MPAGAYEAAPPLSARAQQVRALAAAHASFVQTASQAHAGFLQSRARMASTAMLLDGTGPAMATTAPIPTVTTLPTPITQQQTSVVPAPTKPATTTTKATGPVLFDRRQLESLASDKISAVLGPLFARQDRFPRQVRMPEPPLLLCECGLGPSSMRRFEGGRWGPGDLGLHLIIKLLYRKKKI
jgi:hypothetical protein